MGDFEDFDFFLIGLVAEIQEIVAVEGGGDNFCGEEVNLAGFWIHWNVLSFWRSDLTCGSE